MKTITTEMFFDYLESLDLFRWKIVENENGMEAIIGQGTKPNLENFTQVQRQKDGTFWVRLSNSDYFNNSITKGFFN